MVFKLDARTRKNGTITTPHGSYTYGNIPIGTDPPTAQMPCVSKRHGQTRNPKRQLGNSDSSWRNPRGYGWNIMDVIECESTVWNQFSKHKTYTPPYDGIAGINLASAVGGWWSSNGTVSLDSNMRNEAITQALLRIGDQKSQMGANLGEAKKTFKMLANSSISLLSAYRYARRGHWKAVERELGLSGTGKVLGGRYPANKWLEYQYGWKPLVQDIHGTYEVLCDTIKNKVFLLKSSCTRSREVSRSGSNGTYDFHIRGDQRVRTKLYASIGSPRWRAASQVGLVNPLSIAWELTPHSFLLDWFMPVGNVLEALTARAGLDFIGGCTSWETSGRIDHRNTTRFKPGRTDSLGRALWGVYDFTREQHDGWPLPFLYVRESPFSFNRSLNALALWRSSISSR